MNFIDPLGLDTLSHGATGVKAGDFYNNGDGTYAPAQSTQLNEVTVTADQKAGNTNGNVDSRNGTDESQSQGGSDWTDAAGTGLFVFGQLNTGAGKMHGMQITSLKNSQSILENTHNVNSIKINNQISKFSNLKAGAKWAGIAGNTLGLALTYNNIANEGWTGWNTADAIFGAAAYHPGYGWAISSGYAITKFNLTTASQYIPPVQIMPNGQITGGTSWMSHISDTTYKYNIQPIDSSLHNILSIGGYKYNWVESPITPHSGTDIGLLAQEVETIYPELVTTDSTGVKRIYYFKLIPILVEAVKEQQIIIDEQVKVINNYKQKSDYTEGVMKSILLRLEELENAKKE